MIRKGELSNGIRHSLFAEPSDFPEDVRNALRGAATIEWMLIVLGVLVVAGMVATAIMHR